MIDNRTAPYAAFLLRTALGAMFIAHALLKLLVFTLPGTVAFFQSVGLPGFLAYVTTFAEIAGGAALLLGFQVRWIALALIPVLLGATWVHSGNGWLFTSANGGWEYPAFLSVAALVQVLLGAGAFAMSRDRVAGARTTLRTA
ncbi:MAG TPA: DoxX family protein [Burkholderiaceae bacterium]|nr:DoxX family protein [Burkholderiaceae bacterium]